MTDEMELEVFKAGDYGAKGAWDAAALDGLAADYDPALHEAPVTLDHAQTGPALGWVAGLRRTGDRLVARLHGLNARLLALIDSGAYRKRSVELYPTLRETGRPYLKAVSFLGAAAPEVKGLADPLFAEARGEAMAVIDFPEPPSPAGKAHEHSRGGEPVHAAAFAELTARLRRDGRWQPAWTERGIEEFWRALAAIDEIELDGGQAVNAAEWFARFLEELPPWVTMGEAAPARTMHAGGLPNGGPVDPDSVAMHKAVLLFMMDHPGVEYAEALGLVARQTAR